MRIARSLPISLSENAVFAGTQGDAFARSYALINPSFKVESFCGYCDPCAVFDDIEPGRISPRKGSNRFAAIIIKAITYAR